MFQHGDIYVRAQGVKGRECLYREQLSPYPQHEEKGHHRGCLLESEIAPALLSSLKISLKIVLVG